jgi:Ca2+-binding RTX toxin-like protein
MTGGAGNDTIVGAAGADTIRGDDGADTLSGNGGNDTIIGGAGNDSLYGNAGDDVFLVSVGTGTDYFDGGAGFDTIKAAADNTVISFSQVPGVEAISAGGFANVTIGGTTGDDSWNFSGWTVDSAIVMTGGLGNDTITGSAGADAIRGDEGNDILNGGAGDDTFLIGTNSGGDSIDGGLGFDTIKATANNAVISLSFVNGVESISSNGFSNVTVTGTAGNDTLYFGAISAGGITVNGLAGNDLINGTAGADSIKGDAGLDVLNGGGGDDILDGGADVDNMNGNDGNDTVIGGAGNDTLYGGAGDDVFLVGVGSGMDAFDGGTGYDIIKATADNTVFTFNGPSQFVAIEQLSAGGFKNVTIVGTTGNDEMHFNGLASIDGMPISTGAGADSVDGSQSADNIKSEAGTDTVFGWGGDDVIDGGTEADHLNGNDGNDTIIGGAGNDLLYGAAGDDVFLIGLGAGTDAFDGGTGYDVVKATADNTAISFSTVTALEAFSADGFANVTIVGTTGNDDWNFTNFVVDSTIVITTGAGNDIVMGSAGADTIRGDAGNDSLSGGAGDDVFLIGAGAGSDAFNGGAGYDTIKATADNVAISITSIVGIEAFSSGGFANVSIVGSSVADDMNFTGVLTTGGMVIDGLGGDDKITGTNDVDTLKGGTGNDTIYGLDGNDVIDGGVGLDTLYGGNGDDTFLVGADTAGVVDNYDGGAGSDTVRATANNVAIGVSGMTGIEVFSSGGFTNVTVAGSNNADTLNFTGKTLDGVAVAGLAGNDTITGTSGADTIRGDAGVDTLYGGDGNDILDGGTENDVLFGGAGDDVLLVGASPGTDAFDGGAGFDEVRGAVAGALIYFSSLTGIEKIGSGGFANVQIALQSSSTLANWDFTNIQLEGITRITGGLQNDTIIGSQGDDVIYGYNGSDQLFGGLGDDTFIYSGVPSGNPYTDTVDGGAGWDKLLALGASSMILVSSMTGIEEISTGGFSGVVLGGNWFASDTIDLRGVVITGNLSVDLSGGDDIFYGASGYNGGTAVDIVNGGTGNDYIDTGDGDDIIQVSFNNGLDVIHGGDGYDKVVHVGGGNVNLLFNFDGIEEVSGNGVSLLKIVGTAGDDSIDMRGVILKQVQYITGDYGNDTIYGSYGNDFIMGDRGFDTIYGDDGDDLIWFTAYGDTDTVDGGGGYDTLAAWNDGVIIGVTGLNNIEAISGQSHANVGLAFTNDYDNIDLTGLAVSGIAYIDLKAGDDIFVGTAGADRIIGGLGADYMTGGAGADIFDFNSAAEAGYGANGVSFDEITDFVRGVDKIDLSTIDATPAYAQTDAFTFIGTAAFTGSAGQLRYDSIGWNGFCEVEGDLNGDGIGDFRIRVGGGVSDLSASDFFL